MKSMCATVCTLHTFISLHFYDRLGKFIEIDLHRYIFNATGNYISYYTLYYNTPSRYIENRRIGLLVLCCFSIALTLSLSPIKLAQPYTFVPFHQQPLSIFIILKARTFERAREKEREIVVSFYLRYHLRSTWIYYVTRSEHL